MEKLLSIFGVVALLSLSSAGSALAADCEDQQDEKAGKKKNYRTIVGPDGKKTFVIEKPFVVCGKVPKPTVVYVLQASTINYQWQSLKQDFLPKILKAVKGADF